MAIVLTVGAKYKRLLNDIPVTIEIKQIGMVAKFIGFVVTGKFEGSGKYQSLPRSTFIKWFASLDVNNKSRAK
jgi:hypothetical protein